MSHPSALLLAGNFHSARGLGRAPIEDLAERLALEWRPICVSDFRNGWLRGAHLVLTALVRRPQYAVGVVDLYSGRAFLWGEALSILLTVLRCPFILCMHGGNLPEFSKRWPRRVRACLRRATVVTAPSEYLVNEMHEYREDVRLVPNPLDINLYPFKARSRPAPRLVWLRRFRYVYNPELAPRIVSLLSREFPAIRLTMIGPDWGDGSLQRTRKVADDCDVLERIDFAGGVARSEVPARLGQGDIFLNTTNFDNSPVSILEAMACGLCIVSTDVGGIRYLLEHEKNALVVPPNDPEAMADAVRRILTEPQLGQRLSRNARRKAEEYDWSAILPCWKELLAMAQPRTPH